MSMSIALIPYEEFTIVSPKTKADVLAVLARNIDNKADIEFDSDGYKGSAAFRGSLILDQFTVRRTTSYKNDFKPVLSGRLQSEGHETIINVRIRMTDTVLIVLMIWLLLTGTMLVSSFFAEIAFAPLRAIIFMFFAGYFFSMIGYWLESRKAKKLLADIIDGSI